jgi:RHH-type rel operon transcriptional repressor/antitoxin RelB|tara:strand:- start:231 stop:596 length:366 start_codon:yes stop_codon:yes gene_type:complete
MQSRFNHAGIPVTRGTMAVPQLIGHQLLLLLCYTCCTRIAIYGNAWQWRSVMLAVRLPKEIEARLAELAEKTGRTKTYYVREAIIDHLEELDGKYLAMHRLENPGHRWTLDDLEGSLDLDR